MKDDTIMLSLAGLPEAVVTAAASLVPFERLALTACAYHEPRLGHEGDLVVLAVSESNGYRPMAVQNATGRIVSLFPGRSLIGVLGMRQSTGQAMGQVRKWSQRIGLAAMAPASKLCETGYCLAAPGREYLVFQNDKGEFTVNLTGAPGRFSR